jgi:hypothetical protein
MRSNKEFVEISRADPDYDSFGKFRDIAFFDPESAFHVIFFIPPRRYCEERSTTLSLVTFRSENFSETLVMQVPIEISDLPGRGIGKILKEQNQWKKECWFGPRNLSRKTISGIFTRINDKLLRERKKIRPRRAQGWTLKTCPVCFRRFEQHRPDQKVCLRPACRRAMSRHPRRVLRAWEGKQEWFFLARAGQSILKKPY